MLAENFELKQFIEIVDNIYDEICVWDKDMKIVYMNNACIKHYGMRPDEFVGKTLEELKDREKLWSPTSVVDTISNKRPYIQRQRTFLGYDITTISVPVFDSHDNVKYIIQSCREDEQSLFAELTPITGQMPAVQDAAHSLVYKSKAMKHVLESAAVVATTKAPVLILGETGTGKTLLARYIHTHSDRADKPFVNINMASLNPNLIESEFFGYEQGAFTGARSGGKKGLLEIANGGTLFLDEIGDFPVDLQAKFLSVLQDEEFMPVGGTKPMKLDIRIISATNCDINKLIDAGKFRKDMYHRLNTIELTVPPLRERLDDILVMASFYLKQFNEKYKRHAELSKEVVKVFETYTWPGNIRELGNVIERGVITAATGVIKIEDLPESFFSVDNVIRRESVSGAKEDDLDLTRGFDTLMEDYERQVINAAYAEYPTSRKLAEAMGISQTKASKLIRKYIAK